MTFSKILNRDFNSFLENPVKLVNTKINKQTMVK